MNIILVFLHYSLSLEHNYTQGCLDLACGQAELQA